MLKKAFDNVENRKIKSECFSLAMASQPFHSSMDPPQFLRMGWGIPNPFNWSKNTVFADKVTQIKILYFFKKSTRPQPIQVVLKHYF